MTLSLDKLTRLLKDRSLIPKKYFVIKGLCVYIEVISITTADILMLYIPSKYEIAVRNRDDVYNIDYLEINEDGTIPSDYAGGSEKDEMEQQYDEIDINNEITYTTKDISKQLEQNYNHPLSLKDVNNADMVILREIFRQLRRVKLSVQNIKYKLCIFYKDFICCIRRDNTFDCYSIQSFRGSSEKRLVVSIDLESMYGKLDTIQDDVRVVRNGVYAILNKNQDKHINNLTRMLELKENLTIFSENIKSKKEKYILYLNSMEALLTKLNEAETENLEKLSELDELYRNDGSVNGIHIDMEKSRLISKYEGELSRINITKQELISTILLLKTKYEDLSLSLDNIVFDNIVMVNTIIKNMVKLGDL
jgi:hypothetical protein